MGGDFAPLNCVVGAVQAQNELPGVEVYLIGKTDEIQKVLSEKNLAFASDRIIQASEVIEMCDTPTAAIKTKKDSSIVRGCELVRDGKYDAFVSAGNTGAMMAASTLIIGRIKGVSRPTMGSFMPSEGGPVTIFDAGANVDCKPRHLVEFALMGSIFAKEIYGIANPKVGLLNIGEEESKGNEVAIETLALLKKSKLNFIGNIEGRDIFKGTAHVVVCDGFVGNIVLKFAEGIKGLLRHLLKEYAAISLFNKIKVGLFKGSLSEAMKSTDYQEHGGVPLLGIKGISIIGHGSSGPKAIKNMVGVAKKMYEHRIVEKTEIAIKEYGTEKDDQVK